MARTVRDSKLETRSARLKLPAKSEPYWRGIDQGLHLGYYKGKKGGTWIARYRNNRNKYVKTTIGKTDDISDADGITFYSYSEAQTTARDWFALQGKVDAGIEENSGDYRVRDAAADYLLWFKQNKKSYKETLRRVEREIIPHLGHIKMAKLTTKHIRDWLDVMVDKPAQLRSKKEGKQNFRSDEDEQEAVRKRKSTVNRSLSVLKAILNLAYREGKIDNDTAWRRVKSFEKVDSPRVRFLDQDEIARLLNAADSSFKTLAQGALLTGARYGELTRMNVGDYHKQSESLYLHETKSGKPRYVHLNEEGIRFFDSLTAGKQKQDWIFTRDDDTQWLKSHQTRPMKEACERAKIIPAVGFHILRHTYASHLVMAGTPLNVVAAQLGHSDTRICEKHYAHLSPSYIKDMVREKLPSFGINEPSNVTQLALAK